MNIRQSLIQQFRSALHNQSPQQTITLLALIGIETVLQEDDNIKVREQITIIKKQIENLYPKEQRVQERQLTEENTIRTTKSKERALTPKITECRAPTPFNQQKKTVSRHHLDDQAMKMALSQQYEEPEIYVSPKSTIESMRTPKQSIQYFIEMKKPQNKKPSMLKELQTNLAKEVIVDYQVALEEIKQNPTKYADTPETSLQEQQIKEYIKKQQQLQEAERQQKLQEYNQSQKDLLNLRRRTETQPDKETTQKIESHKKIEQEQVKKTQIQQCQRNKRSPNRYDQQQLPTENTFSFLQKQKTQGNNINTQQSINYDKQQGGLKQMADKLINSPIIRQVSLKSAEEVSPVPEKNVQVSQFDTSKGDDKLEDSITSNSSAFSLFQPNEELKSFFRKELIKDENDENHDPNCVKYSNIFLKGRMGGSKVF